MTNILAVLTNTLQEVNAAEAAVADQDFDRAALLRDLGDTIKNYRKRLEAYKPKRPATAEEVFQLLQNDSLALYRFCGRKPLRKFGRKASERNFG